MTAVDRMAKGYQPNFDIDYAVGKQGELYVASIIDAFAQDRVETKTDEKALRYGHIYVEYECRLFGGWQKSGIATTDSELWAVVIGSDTAVVTPTWRVREAARRLWHQGGAFRRECVISSHPTKGVVIPLRRLFDELFQEVA